jgi:hypothetical protein
MKNTLLTKDRIASLLRYARYAPRKGLFAECGVFQGGMVKLLAENFPHRTILGFDTFEGLPAEHWSESEPHKPKEMCAALEDVKTYINKPNVQLVKGVLPDSAKLFEDQTFAFVHVDLDFYIGTKACLDWFWPRLEIGGMMIFDDYKWRMCPGVEKALAEFPFAKAFPTAKCQAAIKKLIPACYFGY